MSEPTTTTKRSPAAEAAWAEFQASLETYIEEFKADVERTVREIDGEGNADVGRPGATDVR